MTWGWAVRDETGAGPLLAQPHGRGPHKMSLGGPQYQQRHRVQGWHGKSMLTHRDKGTPTSGPSLVASAVQSCPPRRPERLVSLRPRGRPGGWVQRTTVLGRVWRPVWKRQQIQPPRRCSQPRPPEAGRWSSPASRTALLPEAAVITGAHTAGVQGVPNTEPQNQRQGTTEGLPPTEGRRRPPRSPYRQAGPARLCGAQGQGASWKPGQRQPGSGTLH